MDIYQESYEKISNIIAKKSGKSDDADLDMYADDFDKKEQKQLGKDNKDESTSNNDDEEENANNVKWEFKWNQNDEQTEGPHSTEQMQKWSEEGHFKTGVWVRKHGEDTSFYNSNRMDFELYL